MDSIKLFLGKFKDFVPPDLALKTIIREVVKEKTGVELSGTEVQITNFTVYLKAKPAAKSEIFIKREQILEEVGKRFGGLRKTPQNLI